MAPELLRHRAIRRILAVRVVCGHLRQWFSVSAPAALERKSVQVENHNAPAQIIIRGVKFMSGFVKPYFFDASHDHGRGGGVFYSERRYIRWVGSVAATGEWDCSYRARAAPSRNPEGS